MMPFQAFYLVFSLIAFVLAWFRGGHPERSAVAIMTVGYVVSYLTQSIEIGGVRAGEASVDVLMLIAFAYLSLKHSRWWLFFATAAVALAVLVHVAVALIPGLGGRADVAARWGLGVLVVLALLGGVGERWLAGERAPASYARWRRRSTT